MFSIRRYSYVFVGPVAVLAACSAGPSSTLDPSSPDTPPAGNAAEALAAASTGSAPKDWRQAMAKMPRPKDEGCFTSKYPSTSWVEVPCGPPPTDRFLMPRTPLATEAVGNGTDDVPVVSGTISWAEGSFPSVTGITSETDTMFGKNEYSLQLNSNIFEGPSLCQGAADPSICLGWQQFVYDPGELFIEYWLFSYDTTCPSGWTAVPDSGETDCVINSAVTPSPSIPPENLNLKEVSLTGTAGSYDSAILSWGDSVYVLSKPSLIQLASGWNLAEFGVFGLGNRSQAQFSTGTQIVTQVLTDSKVPTTTAPECTGEGMTGETNNLNLFPGSCCPISADPPGLQFLQSNASNAEQPTCPLDPLSPNWSSLEHPFDRDISGTDKDLTLLSACRGMYDGGDEVGKTRGDWDYCDIGIDGQEIRVTPYESLVPAWVDATNGSVPTGAVAFGNDGSASGPTIYSCRAYLNNDGYQLGKVRPGFKGCLVPYGGKENTVANYQVLTTPYPMTTETISSNDPPPGAVAGGYDSNEETLYPCQALYNGGYTPGKTRADWDYCDYGYGNKEYQSTTYNVLIPKFRTGGTVFNAGTDTNGTTELGVCTASYTDASKNTSFQVGRYVTSSKTCSFGYAGKEVALSSGFNVLAN